MSKTIKLTLTPLGVEQLAGLRRAAANGHSPRKFTEVSQGWYEKARATGEFYRYSRTESGFCVQDENSALADRSFESKEYHQKEHIVTLGKRCGAIPQALLGNEKAAAIFEIAPFRVKIALKNANAWVESIETIQPEQSA